MKRLIALMICAVSLGASAQLPNLPYNPDENGDGLVGVVDLQGLLSNYGSEFSGAVISEDGESAITYMGELGRLQCEYACDNLPGYWTLPNPPDLTPVIGAISNYAWVRSQWNYRTESGNVKVPFYYKPNGDMGMTYELYHEWSCYCAAKQLPRVEYTYCEGTTIQTCANDLVDDGWYPLGGAMKHQYNGENKIQAFWRWVE
jgi:hypothetical protein